ncbi:MAG: SteA domain-containing protein, partial [Actinomycetota bacterium]
FLVRMRVGPKLVDAKGVSELHRSGASGWEIAGLLVAAVMTMVIVVLISQPMRLVVETIGDLLKDAWFMIGQAL